MYEATTAYPPTVQRIHAGQTGTTDRTTCCRERDPNLARVPTIADIVPLTEIMTRDITCARGDCAVDRIADLMLRAHIGCVPVVDERGRPVGMITKLDLLEHAAATPGTADQVMMPMTIAVNERATVAHAAALMGTEDVHHLIVVDAEGLLIGVVSTLDIVRWLARNDGFMQ